jgi:hypothetical protein
MTKPYIHHGLSIGIGDAIEAETPVISTQTKYYAPAHEASSS